MTKKGFPTYLLVWDKQTHESITEHESVKVMLAKCRQDTSFDKMILNPFIDFIESGFYPIQFRKGDRFKNRVPIQAFEEFSKTITNSIFYDFYEELMREAKSVFPKDRNSPTYFESPFISNRRLTMISLSLHDASEIDNPEYYFRVELCRSNFKIKLNIKTINSNTLSKSWEKSPKTQKIFEFVINNFDYEKFREAKRDVLKILKLRISQDI